MNRNAPDAAVPMVPSAHEVFTPRFFSGGKALDAPPFEKWANVISNVICEMPDQFAFQRLLIDELERLKNEIRAHVSGVASVSPAQSNGGNSDA